MATYTVELRTLLNSPEWLPKINNIFNDFSYPDDIDNIQRDKLVSKIKEYYYFREIGFETPEQFLFRYHNYFKILWEGKYYNVIKERNEALAIALDALDVTEREYIHGKKVSKTENNSVSGTSQTDSNSSESGTDNNQENLRNIFNENPEKGFNIDSAFDSQQFATTTNLNKNQTTKTFNNSASGGIDNTFETETEKTQNETNYGTDREMIYERKNFDKMKYLAKIESSIENVEFNLIKDLEVLFMKIF